MISSIVSVVAGVFLYRASIEVLHDTVAETSEATMHRIQQRFREQLDLYTGEAKSVRLLFQHFEFPTGDTMSAGLDSEPLPDVIPPGHAVTSSSTTFSGDVESLCEMFWHLSYGRLQSWSGYGSHLKIVKQPADAYCRAQLRDSNFSTPNCTSQYPWTLPGYEGYCDNTVYFDPIELDGERAKVWLRSTKMDPDGVGGYYEDWAVLDNVTGREVYNISSWRKVYDFKDSMATVASPLYEGGRWEGPFLWTGITGVPYFYGMYGEIISPPSFPYRVFFGQYFLVGPWSDVIMEYKSDTNNILIFSPHTGRVFAHTVFLLFQGPPLKPSCYGTTWENTGAGHDCLLETVDLGATINKLCRNFTLDNMKVRDLPGSEIAFVDMDAKQNKTVSFSGEEYFTRVNHIRDVNEDMHLHVAWFKPVSSVSHRVFEAFIRLVLSSVAILCIDLVIAVFEWLMIARPLSFIESGMGPLMRLDMAEVKVHLNKAGSRFMVTEVSNLLRGFEFACESIEAYKAFIPGTVLEYEELDEPSDLPHHEAPGASGGSGSLVSCAIVFTDIVDSTGIWEKSSDVMRAALKQHNTILRMCIATHSGYEVKIIGDSFMVAFELLHDAMSFALSVQAHLNSATWPDTLQVVQGTNNASYKGLLLRIGLNYGEMQVELNPVTSRYDYLGHTVNTAARLESLAQCGTVAVTKGVFNMLGTDFETPYASTSMGQKTLKGIAEPVLVFLLVPATLRERITDHGQKPFLTHAHNPLRPSLLPATETESQSSVSFDVGLDMQLSASCTMAWVGINNTHAESNSMNAILASVLMCAERCDGRVQGLISSSIVVGWNVQRRMSSHMEAAFHFVGLVSCRRGHSDVSIGVASGACVYGQIGAQDRKFVLGAGKAVHLSYALACGAFRARASALYAAVAGHPHTARDDPNLEPRITHAGDWEIDAVAVPVYIINPCVDIADFVPAASPRSGLVLPMHPLQTLPPF